MSSSETKNIVCLTNSRKNFGRCVAGKEVLADRYGLWIRAVSARPSAEISEFESRYENGEPARVLDIIKIRMLVAAPQSYQAENYMIDAQYLWLKTGEFPWADLKLLVDLPAPLWTNNDSTYFGVNDRVKVDSASKFRHSLRLIEPQDLTIKVATEGASRRRVRADFRYCGTRYRLVVTDPVVETALFAKPDAEYAIENAYLCISLSEAYTDGACYKLVASVLSQQPL